MFLAQYLLRLDGCRRRAAGTPPVSAHSPCKMRRMPPRFPEKSSPKDLGRWPIGFSILLFGFAGEKVRSAVRKIRMAGTADSWGSSEKPAQAASESAYWERRAIA